MAPLKDFPHARRKSPSILRLLLKPPTKAKKNSRFPEYNPTALAAPFPFGGYFPHLGFACISGGVRGAS